MCFLHGSAKLFLYRGFSGWFRFREGKPLPRVRFSKQFADGKTVFVGIFLPAEISGLQWIGKLQQGFHFRRGKLMDRFQVAMHFGQLLQSVHIHDTWAVPGAQILGVVQKAFIQLFQKPFLTFLCREDFYEGSLLPKQILIWADRRF